MFNHDLVYTNDFETTSVNGKRHYLVEGKKYPSVTTVLDYCSDKTALIKWKKRVGEKEAERISSVARNRGTAMHTLCERFVLNETQDFKDEMPTTVMMYKQIQRVLEKNLTTVRCVEQCLYSHSLKIAGRVDLIGDYNGEPCIIDFKTSSKLKKKEYITNYFQQASLYSHMFWEMSGIATKKIVILIAVESENDAQIFIEDTKDHIKPSVSMVRHYHNIHQNL